MRFTGKWRQVIQQRYPKMGPEDVTEALRELWVSQRLREDLCAAMEIPRDNVRVLAMGKCGSRALVELVSEDGGVPEDFLRRAGELRKGVLSMSV
eukprot:3830919-Rhodomonas_salina.1